MQPLKIFIGFDPRETIAYHVLAHSIMRRASQPLSITPLSLQTLSGAFKRDRDPLQSTDFAFTRFLVPWLCDFRGFALFMDCDMLCRCDIAELFDFGTYINAVSVVKHDHKPREDKKFLGATQTTYERKNWSSVMLFNNAQCRQLTPEYVSTAPGLDLHQFKWLNSYPRIGNLPHEYNHLVGYDSPNPDAKIVHYTLGGPYFDEYKRCEFSDAWFAERMDMLRCEQRAASKPQYVVV